MKKTFLLIVLSFTLKGISQQDTVKTTRTKQQDTTQKKGKFYNEIGINATLLLKQVISLSNTNFTPLPYDLTYKLICPGINGRPGLGLELQ